MIIHFPLSEHELVQISYFNGDQHRDHVPDQISVRIHGICYEAVGNRSPSNAPELGENAITLLAKELKEVQTLSSHLRNCFYWIYQGFHHKHGGEGVNLSLADEDSGKLLLTPVSLQKEKRGLALEIAVRYPVSFTEKEILTRFKQNLPQEATLSIFRSLPSICRKKDLPEIQLLSEIYREITGNDPTPVTTTGATYARKIPNVFAFGPSFPGQRGIAHNKNEYMTVADLRMNLEIYLRSIKALIE